ncbi:hypothetical protein PHMEG_00036897 [Phytophthora megakarya]|uniref:Uncharacterized protein n=1 Tax=Phytophthora megakarya TaxID=4795 RepID=A0A225UKW8_9STRA|nr:hypothetical protein PHMEG_00036897 [Phytophthora megakarya]
MDVTSSSSHLPVRLHRSHNGTKQHGRYLTAQSKWTAVVQHEGHDYAEWTLDQLKLECTARKLNVVKNTRKQERVELLRAWDTNKEAVQVLLVRQRKSSKRTSDQEETRTTGCMFRLINVLFSDRFFDAFLKSGNLLPAKY